MNTYSLLKKIAIGLAILAGIMLVSVLVIVQSEKKPTPEESVITTSEEPQVEETYESEYVTRNYEMNEVGGIPIIHSYIPLDSPRRPGEIRAIKYITIHETDNRSTSATAKGHNAYLTSDYYDITSWHYTVDDTSIYHNLPDNEVAWNAGDDRIRDGGNINGIGIEMCVNLGIDFEKTIDNTARLTAKLLHTYQLSVEDVKMHADFMEKVCPHRLITEGRVEEFYDLVQTYYESEGN